MRRGRLERAFRALCLAAVVVPLGVLAVLLAAVILKGVAMLDWSFLTGMSSSEPEEAGIYPAVMGTLWVVGMTAAIALPIGVGAAVYLQEYRSKSRLAGVIEVNIANLAGVPSIIYGLLGLEVFVRAAGLGESVLAGACTLALLVMPIVVLASREALRAVPAEIREAGAALGATRWQVVRRRVLPAALPGILTGSILAVSRAIGETAPLIVVGALTFVHFAPDGYDAPFTVLPVQIFNWADRPRSPFATNAAAAIVVLLVVMLLLNAAAIVMRNRLQKRMS